MAKTNLRTITRQEVHTVPHGLWFFCDVALWQHRCFLFIGSVAELKENLEKCHYANDLTPKEIEFLSDWVVRHEDCESKNGDAFGFNTTLFIRLDSHIIGEVGDLAILSHECLHVANAILQNIGLQGDGNCEGLAYTQEFLFKHFLLEMMRQRGLIRDIEGEEE